MKDIEVLENEYDVREYNNILNAIIEEEKEKHKKKEIDRCINIMDMCDVVIHGGAPLVSKKGYSLYKNWWGRMKRRIDKLSGKKQVTVWDRMRKKSNKI